MKLLLLTGRLARHTWTHGPVVAGLVRALRERGHAVSLACDSVDDPVMFEGALERVHRPFEQTSTEWPMGLALWGRRARREIPHDAALSLSRVIGADAWWPLEAAPRAWIARVGQARSPTSLALSLARHRGVLAAGVADALGLLPPRRAGVERVLAVGPSAAAGAAEALAGTELASRIVALDHFSMLPPLDEPQVAALRAAARAALGIDSGARLVLVSAPGLLGRLLDPFVQGLARTPGVRALLLVRDTFSARAAAVRAGCADRVTVMTTTADPAPALAACDAAAVPAPAEGGAFASGRTGRFAADALWIGRPVLVPAAGPGADLVAPHPERTGQPPGALVATHDADGWSRALRAVADDARLRAATDAAERAGRGLAFRRAADTVERVLIECAALRPHPRPRAVAVL